MPERTYPYTAWVLTGSFNVREVQVIDRASTIYDDTERLANDVIVRGDELFPTRAEAIAHGWKKLEAQDARIAKQLRSQEKNKAALKRAEAA